MVRKLRVRCLQAAVLGLLAAGGGFVWFMFSQQEKAPEAEQQGNVHQSEKVRLDVKENEIALFYKGDLWHCMEGLTVGAKNAGEELGGAAQQPISESGEYEWRECMLFNKQATRIYAVPGWEEDMVLIDSDVFSTERTVCVKDPEEFFSWFRFDQMDYAYLRLSVCTDWAYGNPEPCVELPPEGVKRIRPSKDVWPKKLPTENCLLRVRTNTFNFTYPALYTEGSRILKIYDKYNQIVWEVNVGGNLEGRIAQMPEEQPAQDHD